MCVFQPLTDSQKQCSSISLGSVNAFGTSPTLPTLRTHWQSCVTLCHIADILAILFNIANTLAILRDVSNTWQFCDLILTKVSFCDWLCENVFLKISVQKWRDYLNQLGYQKFSSQDWNHGRTCFFPLDFLVLGNNFWPILYPGY